MIEIVEVTSPDDLADLRRDYLASLAAPFDGMWEAFVAMSRRLEIRSAGERAGYFALNGAGQLLQFHLAVSFESAAAKLFAAVVARDEVKGAMVSGRTSSVCGSSDRAGCSSFANSSPTAIIAVGDEDDAPRTDPHSCS